MISSTKPVPIIRNWRRFLTLGLVILGILLIGRFGVRTVATYIRLQQTELQVGTTDVEAIRGWMTIPYIAKAYGIPEEYIFTQLGVPQIENQTKNLTQLNRAYAPGQPQFILNQTKAVILQYRLAYPTSPEEKP